MAIDFRKMGGIPYTNPDPALTSHGYLKDLQARVYSQMQEGEGFEQAVYNMLNPSAQLPSNQKPSSK